MLLLLTIGLVLVATVALVIGFVTSALAPIYVSIACSVLAALVLFFFSRLSKREAPVAVGGPAPLPGPTVASAPAPSSHVAVLETAPQTYEPPVPAEEAPDDSAVTAPVPTVEPLSAPASVADDAFAPQEAAPIEAEAWSASGAEEPEEPEAEEAEEMEAAEVVAPPAATPAATPTVTATATGPIEADEPFTTAAVGDEGQEPIFPIADYDELRVGEIVPLLPELDREELEMVREREEEGKARTSVLKRIEQLLPVAPPPPGELANAAAASMREDASAAPEGIAAGAMASEASQEAPAAPTSGEAATTTAGTAAEEQEPEPEPVAAEAAAFPIDDYDNRKVTEILPRLADLSPEELALVAARERAGKGRGTVLSKVEQLQASPPSPPPAAPAAPAAPAKKAAKAAGGTSKAAAKKASEAAKATKAPAKATPAKKSTKK